MQAELQVAITQFVDDHFPGWVPCEFADAAGQRHVILDKFPIFTTLILGPGSSCPQPGVARCEVLSRLKNDKDEELVRITIAEPDGLETVDGLTEFEVPSELVSIDVVAYQG